MIAFVIRAKNTRRYVEKFMGGYTPAYCDLYNAALMEEEQAKISVEYCHNNLEVVKVNHTRKVMR
jgi:hypothetical protein